MLLSFAYNRFDLDVGHIVEDHLILLHCPLIEDLSRDIFGRDVNALSPRFIQHIGEQPHFELEAQDVHLGDVLLAAFQNDLFDKQPRHRQIYRPDCDQPSSLLAVERGKASRLLRAVGPQDQVEERRFFFFQLLALLFFAQVGVDADVVLAFIFAQIENFKGTIVLALGLELPLDADHPLTCGVNGEFAQIADDPLASQLFGHRGGSARAAEEVGHQVAFVRAGFDDSFEQGFGFLGRIADGLRTLSMHNKFFSYQYISRRQPFCLVSFKSRHVPPDLDHTIRPAFINSFLSPNPMFACWWDYILVAKSSSWA